MTITFDDWWSAHTAHRDAGDPVMICETLAAAAAWRAALAQAGPSQKGCAQTAEASGSDSQNAPQTDPQSEVSQQGSVPSPEAGQEGNRV